MSTSSQLHSMKTNIFSSQIFSSQIHTKYSSSHSPSHSPISLSSPSLPKPTIKEIIIDTETTGLDPRQDRIVELAAIELINGKPTSKFFHSYFNPSPVKVKVGAMAIHGLSNEFLSTKPNLKNHIHFLLKFIEGHKLIAHNAKFDAMMLNSELRRFGLKPTPINQ